MDKESCELRKRILEIAFRGKDANLQSAFSSVEILWVLYNSVINDGCKSEKGKDLFVLSKGQSTLALLTVLARKKILNDNELDEFCKYSSKYGMQIDRTKFNGEIISSSGSLGHGFPMAVGMAMAKKIKKESGRVYVLAGDGEMNEGTMWEACILAATYKLDNLCLIIDDNNSVSKMVNIGRIEEKLKVFNFEVNVCNGHDIEDLCKSIQQQSIGKPLAVVAKTQRGYGSKTLMSDNSWFHRAPSESELKSLILEVQCFEKTNDRISYEVNKRG